ncbi:uncharacterized protein LOC121836696 [Ixodes scapularis]|uniref:uncharacterized protein LOC121836696 n=1 Tax=Ixodes scapularis TaxID=6945 RepID=UPI001C3837EE|nr:uncharacterized protein LOC121836696 [Ixodes scapularis]
MNTTVLIKDIFLKLYLHCDRVQFNHFYQCYCINKHNGFNSIANLPILSTLNNSIFFSTESDSAMPTDVTKAMDATAPSWQSIVGTEATTPINAPSGSDSMIPSDGATAMNATESHSAMPTDVTKALNATGPDSNIPTDVTTALNATAGSDSMIPSDEETAMDATGPFFHPGETFFIFD